MQTAISLAEAAVLDKGLVSALRMGIQNVGAQTLPATHIGAVVLVFNCESDDALGEHHFEVCVTMPNGDVTTIVSGAFTVKGTGGQMVVCQRVIFQLLEQGPHLMTLKCGESQSRITFNVNVEPQS